MGFSHENSLVIETKVSLTNFLEIPSKGIILETFLPGMFYLNAPEIAPCVIR